MKAINLRGTVKASFPYTSFDENGEQHEETVNLVLKRFEFRKAVSEEFQKLFENFEKNKGEILRLICDLVQEWDIYTDEAETEMLPISTDVLETLPVDFIMRVFEVIAEKLLPNPQTAKP